MPLHLVSPFDREVETPPGDNPPGPISTRRWRQPLRDICFILIKAGAYLGSIYLAVLGLPLLFFRLLARGGMYDVVGGGFSRYSTDNLWRVPHFEK